MIEVGKEYYVVSDKYDWLDPMDKVKIFLYESGKQPLTTKTYFENGEKKKSIGYVDENDLLSADEIIKVWQNHRMIVDSFERHG